MCAPGSDDGGRFSSRECEENDTSRDMSTMASTTLTTRKAEREVKLLGTISNCSRVLNRVCWWEPLSGPLSLVLRAEIGRCDMRNDNTQWASTRCRPRPQSFPPTASIIANRFFLLLNHHLQFVFVLACTQSSCLYGKLTLRTLRSLSDIRTVAFRRCATTPHATYQYRNLPTGIQRHQKQAFGCA